MNHERSIRVLSIGLGILLLFHGVDKAMNGTDFIAKMLGDYNLPYSEYLVYGVFVGEIIAPIMLIAGQYIRIAGAIIAFNMLVAIFLVHQGDLFSLGEHGAWSIELPMLYLIGGLSLALLDRPKKAEKK